MVIDNAPLQRAAWAEFRTARKRHDKAARNLHRHEQVDVPEYEAWLHRTFPVVITTLRDLHNEVFTKSRQVQMVQAMAAITGRSAKKLWRAQQDDAANPKPFEEPSGFHDDGPDEEAGRGTDDFFSGGHRSGSGRGHGFRDAFETGFGHTSSPPENREAKSIYRRLVQHLHPDRGGNFTPARKRLWHEIQQAWAARDVDWLSRLEIEWETASEVLSPTSPLSRLHRAIDLLHAARRDTERKLRQYRRAPQWRFTLSEPKRDALHRRVQANFEHDLHHLRRQLAFLNATIAAWESARPQRSRQRRAAW